MLVKCECGWTGDLRKIDQSIQDIDYGPVYVCPDCGVHNDEDMWEYIPEEPSKEDVELWNSLPTTASLPDADWD